MCLIPCLRLLRSSLWFARARLVKYERIGGLALGSVLGLIAVHSLYKLIFAIQSDFVTYGMAERTLKVFSFTQE